ncbi:hypothetical protein COLO4_37984 [Corchorus olitorius]|uniref:Uncharacterized protein n=1 Tax=Corchorus olitorius TaxID=93759 RepID=A0A1R3FXM7_9ROSI|nr:hypothetical protein COLO4_37984 [Corchorus olitorius]
MSATRHVSNPTSSSSDVLSPIVDVPVVEQIPTHTSQIVDATRASPPHIENSNSSTSPAQGKVLA